MGVYDADGGIVGELSYVIGHALGRAECALCDITHGRVRRKAAFDDLCTRLAVPFTVVHRNERSADVAAASGDHLPCVLVETGGAFTLALSRSQLERCGGDVARFEQELRTALAALAISLPARPAAR